MIPLPANPFSHSQGILGDLAMSSLQSEILGEDFDNLLQYNDPTPQQGKIMDKATLKQSTALPQLYHHDDLHHGLGSGAVSTEPPCLAKGSLDEAKQLFCDLQPKTSAKCDSVLPLDVPKTSTIRDSILIEDGASQKELSDHFSAIVDAEFASCNNHNQTYMSYEASQVLPSDFPCTFSGSASLGIENMSPAVLLDLLGDSETTTADCGNCEGDDHASRDEVGAVDLDSSASKELADLFLELRRNLSKQEGGVGDSNQVLVKGMVKIGEIDEFTEDGLPLDLVEELDRNAHQFSSSM